MNFENSLLSQTHEVVYYIFHLPEVFRNKLIYRGKIQKARKRGWGLGIEFPFEVTEKLGRRQNYYAEF